MSRIIFPLIMILYVVILVYAIMTAKQSSCYSVPDINGPDSMAMKWICR